MRKSLAVSITGILAAIMLAFGGVGAAQASNQSDIISNVNAGRGGAGALSYDGTLAAAAQSWADRMTGPTHSGYRRDGWIIGEAVAWTPEGNTDAAQVVAAWRASGQHAATIYGSSYRFAGAGYSPNGGWVIIVGSPVPVQAAPAPAPAPPPPAAVAPPAQNTDSNPTISAPPPPPASQPTASSPRPSGASSSATSSAPSSSTSSSSSHSSSSGVLSSVAGGAAAAAGMGGSQSSYGGQRTQNGNTRISSGSKSSDGTSSTTSTSQGAQTGSQSNSDGTTTNSSDSSKGNSDGSVASNSDASRPLTKAEALRLSNTTGPIEAATNGSAVLILLALLAGIFLAVRRFGNIAHILPTSKK